MTTDDVARLRAQLRGEEAVRLLVYDDATGKPLKKGDTLIGNPTIGVGRELSRHGISLVESDYLLNNDILEVSTLLARQYPWFAGLDSVRQRAIIDMAFNQGVEGLQQHSPETVKALAAGDYERAATEMLDGPWQAQVGARATTIAQMVRTGHDPHVTVSA